MVLRTKEDCGMTTVFKHGLLLGILCEVWTFIMGVSGWYRHPTLLNLFWVVVLIQIGILLWSLRLAALDRTYWGQVGAGTMISLIAAVIIFCGSLLFTSVVFPHYFDEMRSMQIELLRSQGKPEAEIVRLVAETAKTQMPFMTALFGFIGTGVTGLVSSLVIGIFFRKSG
jgi:hypothetical protein